MDKLKNLKLRQVEERLSMLKSLPRTPPSGGWVRLIRSALGMSVAQLAHRLGLTRQALAALEKREQDGTVTLKALYHTAEALGCDLVYAIVPRSRLADAIERQAMLRAKEEIEGTAHSMRLEDQGVSPEETERLIQDRAKQLLVTRKHDFWKPLRGKEYEVHVRTKDKRRGRPSKR